MLEYGLCNNKIYHETYPVNDFLLFNIINIKLYFTPEISCYEISLHSSSKCLKISYRQQDLLGTIASEKSEEHNNDSRDGFVCSHMTHYK